MDDAWTRHTHTQKEIEGGNTLHTTTSFAHFSRISFFKKREKGENASAVILATAGQTVWRGGH